MSNVTRSMCKIGQHIEVAANMIFEDFADTMSFKVWPWLYVGKQEGSAHQLVASVSRCWNFSTMTSGWHNS